MDAKARHDRIKRGVGKRHRLGVAFGEMQCRMCGARLGQHRRREIEPGDHRAARGGFPRDEPGAAAPIEHCRPQRDAGGVEQRVGEFARCLGEGHLVMRRRLLPAGMLEGADGVRVEVGLVGDHLSRVNDNCPWHKDCRWSKRRARRVMALFGFLREEPKEKMRGWSDRFMIDVVFDLDDPD
jgi:hypothetical protein